MRKTIDLQMEFFKKDIANITFDLTCRDEIPKVLLGLQYIYATSSIREKIFNELSPIVPKKCQETGRPGMDLWKILVLGTLRLNCNWDYDKVHEMANNHHKIRQMLGHGEMDFESSYALQTIRDNVALLTPEILDKINRIVVKAGHDLISPSKTPALKGSCDSFVVETDVHFPTDSNLLFDAMRKMISGIALICWEIGLSDWRQSQHNIRTIKKQLRVIQRLRHSTSKNETKKEERAALIVAEHQKYIKACQGFIFKTKETIGKLRQSKALSFTHDLRLMGIETYIQHAERQIDQIYRRIVLDET